MKAKLLLLTVVAILLMGCNKMETTDIVETTETVDVATEMVDMSKVVSFEETETGVLLNFADGSGYYLEVPNVTEYVYPICDVVYSYGDTVDSVYKTNLICAMPDGELHTYAIQDPPEGNVELVCFKTLNQENYEAYKVIGAR